MPAPVKDPAPALRRACEVCGARLSSYNANRTCHAHTLALPWKGPHTRPR